MFKGIKNLGFVLFLLLFASCGSDSSKDALIGTWTAQTLNGTDVTLLGITRTMDGTNFTDATIICSSMEGTYTTSGGDITFTVTSSSGFCGFSEGDSWTTSYTVSGDTLTFTDFSETWVYTK